MPPPTMAMVKGFSPEAGEGEGVAAEVPLGVLWTGSMMVAMVVVESEVYRRWRGGC